MNTTLTLEIASGYNLKKTQIDFFVNEHLTVETESVLMQHIHKLIGIIRQGGKELNIHLNAEVADAGTALFMINKQKNKCAINEHHLTEREKEILELIMKGFTNNEIAKELFISLETVRTHRKHILTKTGTKNTASLVKYYYQSVVDNNTFENVSINI